MAVIGDPQENIGVQMLKALGLPATKCTKLVLTFEAKDVVRATAEYLPNEAEASKMVEIVRQVRRWA